MVYWSAKESQSRWHRQQKGRERKLRRLGKLRLLKDMTEGELRNLEQQYGMPVLRPRKGKVRS